jgi:hypothetical protein
MKKIVILVVLVSLALTGCVSGKFLGFLATADYVDAKAKEVVDQQAAEIGQLKAQLADYQVIKEQAQAAAAQVSQTQKTIDDLQALAKRAEERIGSIPREVIKQIVDILQSALQ